MPTPAKESNVPAQAIRLKRSPRKDVAKIAVRIGLTLMMKLAAPAETVSSPKLSSAVYRATKPMPPTPKRQASWSAGSAGRVTIRKIAAGTAAMAKRIAPSSSGPKLVSPARIAGKAEAQATTVTTIATPRHDRPWVTLPRW